MDKNKSRRVGTYNCREDDDVINDSLSEIKRNLEPRYENEALLKIEGYSVILCLGRNKCEGTTRELQLTIVGL